VSPADFSIVLWAVLLVGWAGYLLGARDERKQHNASLEAFAYETLSRAERLTEKRKWVGSGVTLINEGKWSFGETGLFKVTIEQAEEEVA
jgi:hypothetical protein